MSVEVGRSFYLHGRYVILAKKFGADSTARSTARPHAPMKVALKRNERPSTPAMSYVPAHSAVLLPPTTSGRTPCLPAHTGSGWRWVGGRRPVRCARAGRRVGERALQPKVHHRVDRGERQQHVGDGMATLITKLSLHFPC